MKGARSPRYMIPQGAGALRTKRAEGSWESGFLTNIFTDSRPRGAVATRSRFEWTGSGRWESAGFNGSFVVDSMEGASMIQVNCLNDLVTMLVPSCVKKRETLAI